MAKRYSHSKLSTFEQCPAKFKYRYLDKVPVEFEKTIESFFGEIIHKTLEWLYSQVKEKKIPSLDATIEHYANVWEEEFSKEKLKLKEKGEEKNFFEKGVKILIEYYTSNHPFEDVTIEVEKEILFPLDKEGRYYLWGFIDRLAYNPSTKQYEIHDYKTANSLPNKERIERDRQLSLYSLAIREMLEKEQEMLLVWHYLIYNKTITSRRTEEELTKLVKETLNLIEKIENTKEFPKNKSPLCNWCEYKNFCESK